MSHTERLDDALKIEPKTKPKIEQCARAEPVVVKDPRAHAFPTLDLLRGLGAPLVVIRHAGAYFGTNVLPQTYLALDMFFVLSGVVVAHAYAPRLTQGLNFAQFAAIRLIRLYPLYLLGLIAGIAAVAVRLSFGYDLYEHYSATSVAVAIVLGSVMLPTLDRWSMFPINGPSWSLFHELVANAFFGLFHPRLTPAVVRLLIVGAGVVLVAIVARGPEHDLNQGWQWRTVHAGLARVGYSFFMGIFLYRLYVEGHFDRLRAIRGWSPILAWGAALAMVGLLAATPPDDARGAYDLMCVLVLFPLLVGAAMCFELDRYGIRLAALLGSASYTIYVLHAPVAYLIRAFLDLGLGVNVKLYAPWSGVVLIAVLVMLAVVVNGFYDGPLRAWATRRARTWLRPARWTLR